MTDFMEDDKTKLSKWEAREWKPDRQLVGSWVGKSILWADVKISKKVANQKQLYNLK